MCRLAGNWFNRLLYLVYFCSFLLVFLILVHDLVHALPATVNSNLPNFDAGPSAKDETKIRLMSQIDSAVNSLQKCVQFPGMSMAIIKLGKTDSDSVVFTRNYGVMDIESRRPVDDDTRFCIGSVTKGFTAALLVQMLRDNGSYSIDTPVQAILGPDFQLNTADLSEKCSIRDILAHRVGVAKHFGAFLMGYNMSRPEIVRKVRHLPVLKPFRASIIYNNFMYVVAGQLAGKMNGTWWENLIVTKFLKKLKMDKTTFADRVADWNTNFALPHALANGQLRLLRAKVTGNILRPVGPAGSICTTAGDMAEWLSMYLRNGVNSNGQSVLDPAVIQQMFEIHNPFVNTMGVRKDGLGAESLALGYGLGWGVGKYRDTKRLIHSGFANYYYTLVSMLPDKNIAIFTALNGPHLVKCDNGMKALHFYITDLLLGEKPWLDASTICTYPRQWLQKDANHNVDKTTTEPFTSSKEDIPRTSTEYFSTVPSSTWSATTWQYDDTTMPSEFTTSDDFASTMAYTSGDFTKTSDEFLKSTTEDSNVQSSTAPNLLRRPSLKLKKRRMKITTFAPETLNPEMHYSPSTTESILPDTSTIDNLQTSPVTDFSELALDLLTTTEISSSTQNSTQYGSRLRPGSRPLRRRRPKRDVGIMSYFKKYEGRYNNPFFGDLVISVNRTVLALQLNYGYYGKALLQPISENSSNIFRMRFFNSIWYQSESDDMKLFAKLGIFNVQFGGSSSENGIYDKIVVFLFDTEKPPIFTKYPQK